MGLGSFARRVVPPKMRARLRRSPSIRWMLSKVYGGVVGIKHSMAPYTFYFDRERHPGMASDGIEESGEMASALDLIRKLGCKCSWEVGANVGAWTLLFAGARPPVERIVSFEPDAKNHQYLKMNVDRNGLAGIVDVRQMALSDHTGEAVFYGDPLTGCTGTLEPGHDFIAKHFGVQRVEIKVPLSTIDAEIAGGLPVPDIIKIDVEGHEFPLLRGAAELLSTAHPTIIMEVTREIDQVTELLRGHGYELFSVAAKARIQRAEFATLAVHHSNVRAAGL